MSTENTKKPLWKNKWLWVGVVVVLLVIAQLGSPSSSTEATSNSASEKVEPPKPAAEIITTAEQYFNEYEGNEIAADKRYKGKLLQITGTVEAVRKTLGTVYVDLETSNMFLQVACEMQNEDDAATLSKGSVVTLIGEGAGKVMYPSVDNCVLK